MYGKHQLVSRSLLWNVKRRATSIDVTVRITHVSVRGSAATASVTIFAVANCRHVVSRTAPNVHMTDLSNTSPNWSLRVKRKRRIGLFFRNRVLAPPAAGMAACDTSDSHSDAPKQPPFPDRLDHVTRTGRREPASCRKQGREAYLVEPDDEDEDRRSGFFE